MKNKKFLKKLIKRAYITTILVSILQISMPTHIFGDTTAAFASKQEIADGFLNPPDSVRPGVYWYFMDGNLSREAMTADLESMKEAGIGCLVYLEVDVGVPRGPIGFLSNEWQDLYKHAVLEAERLGIAITMGVGPGWTGSGGPWVKPEQSMLHLVASTTEVNGPQSYNAALPVPPPRRPFFGEEIFTDNLKQKWLSYYQDVFVLAFPTPSTVNKIADIDEKALYYRAPYTSQPGVKPYLPSYSNYSETPVGSAVEKDKIINITDKLRPDGSIEWDVPAGKWTIMRFGTRNNGGVTRPAPYPGLGFECDKFDKAAFDAHFEEYLGKLIKKVGKYKTDSGAGLAMLHMDSWEMGSQNWSGKFRDEFKRRRGYDPLPFFPAYTGNVVCSNEITERFLWDIRLTAQELVIENHAGRIKEIGSKYGLGVSIEPYDMNPCADLDLGYVADVPMCEFWSKGYGFNSAFSCIEASSIAHIKGIPVVAAESFTADDTEAWKQYPGSMKDQGDWAFCAGVNHFFYHTFAHKASFDNYLPGMTMGPYGVHWDRGQTWWPMASAYHKYISRCSYVLQQGRTVADVLYLTPEGAPQVFRAPSSALTEDEILPDRREYNFDGCSPLMLISKASVSGGKIVFPGGACYELLVLPAVETMTPELVDKIESLVKDGAVIVGAPPLKSPSLVNYPECDNRVRAKAKALWGEQTSPQTTSTKIYGKGKIYWGGNLSVASGELYPTYESTASLLKQMGVSGDFIATGPIRYTHRTTGNVDIYFVSNRENSTVDVNCSFRTGVGKVELWDPLTTEKRELPEFSRKGNLTSVPLRFEPYQSFFVVFDNTGKSTKQKNSGKKNFPEMSLIAALDGTWNVSFNPKMGGPENVIFEKLTDWIARPEEGIRYYSGIAVYSKTFDLPSNVNINDGTKICLDLGEVNVMARVRLNGQNMGVVWTAPWIVDITKALKSKGNRLEIDVANLWPNRLIGDEQKPDDGVKDGKFPAWLLNGTPRPSDRYTFTTLKYYKKDSPLFKSGLIGPVRVIKEK